MERVPAIRVLVVDDHRMIRDGLKAMLISFKKDLPMEVSSAATIPQAMNYLRQFEFELAIVDYQLGEGRGDELIRKMLVYQPSLKVLALSYSNDREVIERMTDAGALGYVLKSILPEQMLQAITTVLAGKNYYCNEVAIVLLSDAEATPGSRKISYYQLTTREVEVLFMIADGMRNATIAERLFVARRTIDTHRQNLMRKLNVHNTAGLVKIAMELRRK